MGRVCVGRLCYGPTLQWADFAMGRDVQLPTSWPLIGNLNLFLRLHPSGPVYNAATKCSYIKYIGKTQPIMQPL